MRSSNTPLRKEQKLEFGSELTWSPENFLSLLSRTACPASEFAFFHLHFTPQLKFCRLCAFDTQNTFFSCESTFKSGECRSLCPEWALCCIYLTLYVRNTAQNNNFELCLFPRFGLIIGLFIPHPSTPTFLPFAPQHCQN